MLERNNLPLSDFLDARKMMRFLSQRELANCLHFQGFHPFEDKTVDGRSVPNCDGESIVCGRTDITEYWPSYQLSSLWRTQLENTHDAEDKALLEMLSSVQWQFASDYLRDEMNVRFDPDNVVGLTRTEPFITYELDHETAAVVIYPSFFNNGSRNEILFSLCKEVLKVLYVYNTYAAGCKTPYFRKYLEFLA
jgi:uncharacterized Fe-S cluster-containing protein